MTFEEARQEMKRALTAYENAKLDYCNRKCTWDHVEAMREQYEIAKKVVCSST